MTKRIDSSMLAGMDFSHVRAFVVGAEVLDAELLRRFELLLCPHGFPQHGLRPAYGLAEATLAVSGTPLYARWRSRPNPAGGREVVGCGQPLLGVELRIVDDTGARTQDGAVGEIVVSGAALARGYHGSDASVSHSTFERLALRTGDAGFVMNGELFPLGRFGDSIRVAGRSLFAESLEAALHSAGYPRESNVVLLGHREGQAIAAWISERAGTRDPAAGVRTIAAASGGIPVLYVCAPRGTIRRTSSGKPQRNTMWNALLAQCLAGEFTTYSRAQEAPDHGSVAIHQH
jgi:acyl-CoA synthetase (AMP-forming)/AMP-acid ligase II